MVRSCSQRPSGDSRRNPRQPSGASGSGKCAAIAIGSRPAWDKRTARATDARTYFDYVRALRFYTNGFQDGHIGLALQRSLHSNRLRPASSPELHRMAPPRLIWGLKRHAGVRVGERILECDGRSVDDWMTARVDPYFWNPAIPHERC